MIMGFRMSILGKWGKKGAKCQPKGGGGVAEHTYTKSIICIWHELHRRQVIPYDLNMARAASKTGDTVRSQYGTSCIEDS